MAPKTKNPTQKRPSKRKAPVEKKAARPSRQQLRKKRDPLLSKKPRKRMIAK